METDAGKLVLVGRYWLLGRNYLNALWSLEKTNEVLFHEKRNGGQPAIIHQIQIFHMARAFEPHIENFDEFASAIFMHDMLEDFPEVWHSQCVNQLPEESVQLVESVSKVQGIEFESYIQKCIHTHELSYLLKLLDRVNNMSTAPIQFKKERLERYIRETKYMISQVKVARKKYPKYESVYDALKVILINQVQMAEYIIQYK